MRETDVESRVERRSQWRAGSDESPPKLFECKLCGKTFDSDEEAPTCPECDSKDVEQVG